jgi:hypothetical protein
MSFILSRVLTNCQKWLTTCQKWWTTCLQTVKKWWFIDIQSILPIDYRKNQYNRTIIGLSKTSNEFHLQREHTDRQTNRRQRCFLYIIKKNTFILPQTRLLIYTENLYLHTLHRYKHTIQGRPPSPPVAPRRQYTYRQSIRTNAQTRVSIFHVSTFWEREAH